LSGSSALPAYPGFIVMLMNAVYTSLVPSYSKNVNSVFFPLIASFICVICIAITESTSAKIRLNSSKQHQDPVPQSPLKNLHIAIWSMELEQLKTTHCIAHALAKSLTDSVFPVPAGPSGPPPYCNWFAHSSVR